MKNSTIQNIREELDILEQEVCEKAKVTIEEFQDLVFVLLTRRMQTDGSDNQWRNHVRRKSYRLLREVVMMTEQIMKAYDVQIDSALNYRDLVEKAKDNKIDLS